MIMIGEKINGFIPKTLAAIDARDAEYIATLAQGQADGGADFLDICAGTAVEKERETLRWLIGLVQETVDLPLCLDSSDPEVLIEMMPLCNKSGVINSVSLEEGKCETIFPAIAGTSWKVIALTCDKNGIPTDPAIKAQIADEIIKLAAEADIKPDRILIDPLVTTLATQQDSLVSFQQTVSRIKEAHPDVHFTSGLSNISFGMPFRRAINMQFLALAMAAGMDSAIMDPMSADMQATLYATNALLGKDEYCMEYLQAYRGGLFGAQ
jgi:5-methyltetrahydrofolate--homocysteine methyltransferase